MGFGKNVIVGGFVFGKKCSDGFVENFCLPIVGEDDFGVAGKMVEIDFQGETVENGAALNFVVRGVGRTKPNLVIVDEIRFNEDVLAGEVVLYFAIVVSFDEGEIVIGKIYRERLEAVDGSSE